MDCSTSTGRFGGYLRDTPVQVFVGNDKTTYFVHPGVLSACKSSTADVHMGGLWKDVSEGAIDWTDFDEQTIECVLHYLYTGDYHVNISGSGNSISQPEDSKGVTEQVRGHAHDSSLATRESPTAGQSTACKSPQSEVSSHRPLTPIQECTGAGFPTEQVRTAAGLLIEQDLERDKHVIGVTVLTHARVYSFAHRHFFTDLAKLALQRLTQILYLAPCDPNTLFPYLGDAVRHIYDTTPGPELQEDPARKLLSHYFSLHYTDLASEDLRALVEEGGDLMVDISQKLTRLLATKSSQISALETRINCLSTELGDLQVIWSHKEEEIQKIREIDEVDDWCQLSRCHPKKKRMKNPKAAFT